jgi:hypothetical protein
MLFNLGEYEILIIVLAFGFLVLGVPALALIAAKLGTGVKHTLKRWLSYRRG